MRVIQVQVFKGGRVRAWLQSDEGERIYCTLEDAAFSDGLLDALLAPLQAHLRAAQPEPGRSSIHGRPTGSGP